MTDAQRGPQSLYAPPHGWRQHDDGDVRQLEAYIADQHAQSFTLDELASRIHVSVRTLQRRLDDSQVSFSDILNAVRCELAQRYIKHTPHAFGRVAELLGYSNTSSFNRWFTVQFGCTPSQMRG